MQFGTRLAMDNWYSGFLSLLKVIASNMLHQNILQSIAFKKLLLMIVTYQTTYRFGSFMLNIILSTLDTDTGDKRHVSYKRRETGTFNPL